MMSEKKLSVDDEIARANGMVALGQLLVMLVVVGSIVFFIKRESRNTPPAALTMPVTVKLGTLEPKQVFVFPNGNKTYVVLNKDENQVWAFPIDNTRIVERFPVDAEVVDFPGLTAERKY